MHGFLAGDPPRAFAHRGGDEVAPENTMAAFQDAVDLGYVYLETAVHLTADGRVVAFHDDTLDRVSDGTGKIAELPWKEVAQATVGDGHRVPLLEELLDAFPAQLLNIDPNHDAVVGPLGDLIQRRGLTDRVCVGSFSDARLAELRRRLGAGLCLGLGPRQVAKLVAASRGAPVGQIRGRCAQVSAKHRGRRLVDRRLVETAHERGLEVHVWTVNDAAEMQQLLDLGVDGIMTDRPSVLKDVLVSRAQWRGLDNPV